VCSSGATLQEKMNKAITELKQLYIKDHRARYPNLPEYARSTPRYNDKTANDLTRCVIDWIELQGYQAERIANMGRPIDQSKVVTDVLGNQRRIGNVKWIPGQGTNGTSDISAIIAGRSVKIEVKIGRDRQSEVQKKYQEAIEKAGGIYIIVRSFKEFLQWYNKFINEN